MSDSLSRRNALVLLAGAVASPLARAEVFHKPHLAPDEAIVIHGVDFPWPSGESINGAASLLLPAGCPNARQGAQDLSLGREVSAVCFPTGQRASADVLARLPLEIIEIVSDRALVRRRNTRLWATALK